nr:LRR receptor-like serine/threonine-protein kinase FLS2 [Ziziphus jujuba var. spinosa]
MDFTLPPAFILFFGFYILHNPTLCDATSSNFSCIPSERQALLSFKHDLHDPALRLASWVGDDCCNWSGVVCSKLTGHVHKLLLGDPDDQFYQKRLSGEINPSLVDVKHLRHLDLSNRNNIPLWVSNLRSLTSLYLRSIANGGSIPDGIQNLTSPVHLGLSDNSFNTSIPRWLYSLSHLEVLNLDFNRLRGSIPEDIQNLNSLVHLDLSRNSFNTSMPSWLYSLSHLGVLNLAGNQLTGTISSEIKNMTSIITLDLHWNELQGDLPTSSMAQLCKLKEIDLSDNTRNRSISQILDSFSGCLSDSLQVLNISGGQIYGHLTNKIGQFKTLTDLDLSNNSISGPIPASLGNLSSLRAVSLGYNHISETLPEYLGQLVNLEDLDIGKNQIEGIVSEAHFC